MKKIIFLLIIHFFLLGLITPIMASNYLAQADAIYEKSNLESVIESLPLYRKAVKENPDSYEANWKIARALREYANLSMETGIDDWKEICKEYGREGLKYAEIAQDLEPDRLRVIIIMDCLLVLILMVSVS